MVLVAVIAPEYVLPMVPATPVTTVFVTDVEVAPFDAPVKTVSLLDPSVKVEATAKSFRAIVVVTVASYPLESTVTVSPPMLLLVAEVITFVLMFAADATVQSLPPVLMIVNCRCSMFEFSPTAFAFGRVMVIAPPAVLQKVMVDDVVVMVVAPVTVAVGMVA